MDVLGVQQMKIQKHAQKRCRKDVKVVYISSPMKVKTCASKFRALVQELTGKDSDADAAAMRFPDVNGVESSPKVVNCQDGDHYGVSEGCVNLMNCPTISEAAMESIDDWFVSHGEGSFLGMFTSNPFHHDINFQLDHRALKNFESV